MGETGEHARLRVHQQQCLADELGPGQRGASWPGWVKIPLSDLLEACIGVFGEHVGKRQNGHMVTVAPSAFSRQRRVAGSAARLRAAGWRGGDGRSKPHVVSGRSYPNSCYLRYVAEYRQSRRGDLSFVDVYEGRLVAPARMRTRMGGYRLCSVTTSVMAWPDLPAIRAR